MGLDHGLKIYNKDGQELANIIWRKENHFHKWWVDHADGGDNDDVQVEGNLIYEFLDDIETVITSLNKGTLDTQEVPNGRTYTHEKGRVDHVRQTVKFEDTSVAEEVMPTQGGFFFGSTDYEEYYYQSLEEAKTRLKDILGAYKPDDLSGVYWSWW